MKPPCCLLLPLGEPEDLLDLGVEPETTEPIASGGGGAAFGAPDQALDDTHLLDDLDPLTPVVKDESEHVTAEQIFQELEDPAQDNIDSAEPALETSELVEPELPEGDIDPNAAETLNPDEPKEEESDFEEVRVEEEPVGTAEASEPTVGEEDCATASNITFPCSGRGSRRRSDHRLRSDWTQP